MMIVITAVNILRKRLEHYRDASRKAAGRVTGFMGEMFGAVQAVKVASKSGNFEKHIDIVTLDSVEERHRFPPRGKFPSFRFCPP